ncbi:hypothetical protein PIB30_069921 [Stylosanthes scabra]|uniref:Uncharacterized protein n=1 Tax=Stylosanthes scabra TaxID=79078 RepID=A0ABU6QPH8_9FABA|nr:hypothetical protein [Stylosanthes scabra]
MLQHLGGLFGYYHHSGVVNITKIGDPNDVLALVWYQSKVDHYLALVKFYLVRGYGFGALLSRLACVVVRAGRSVAEVRVISFFFSPLFLVPFVVIIFGALSSSLVHFHHHCASSSSSAHHQGIIIIIIASSSSSSAHYRSLAAHHHHHIPIGAYNIVG